MRRYWIESTHCVETDGHCEILKSAQKSIHSLEVSCLYQVIDHEYLNHSELTYMNWFYLLKRYYFWKVFLALSCSQNFRNWLLLFFFLTQKWWAVKCWFFDPSRCDLSLVRSAPFSCTLTTAILEIKVLRNRKLSVTCRYQTTPGCICWVFGILEGQTRSWPEIVICGDMKKH